MGVKTDKYGAVSQSTIDSGMATDAYFLRTEESLSMDYADHRVVAEVTADQFPDENEEILVGVDNVAELLTNTGVNMWSLPSGTPFDGGPVMYIEGEYSNFARYETALLGMLSEASGYATKARKLSDAAGDVPVMSFGSRHNHPATAAIMERAAFIGGVDGYSNVAARDSVPIEPSGTMPHALILTVDDRKEAWELYNKGVDSDVPRTVLVDTFADEVQETKEAVETLGSCLDGIRLDTTGSRRGDFEHIIKEVRYELRQMGREDVDIIVSGGLGVDDIEQLKDLVDGFGVGSAISDAPSVDFSLDIVQTDGKDTSKRGKLPGVKDKSKMIQYLHNGVRIDNVSVSASRRRAEYGDTPGIEAWAEFTEGRED